MWRMLQLDEPDDFLLATNETHSVREFAELTFKELGVKIEWIGSGLNERGVVANIENGLANHLEKGDVIIEVHDRYFRPTEVAILIGDYSKAREKLNWSPKVKIHELVKIMLQSDFAKVKKELLEREWDAAEENEYPKIKITEIEKIMAPSNFATIEEELQ
jgi:GDPmannose 4,6-dehydratase